MQRYNAFLVAPKLGLSRRMCHEEYGNYSEAQGDYTLHEEDLWPAYEASQLILYTLISYVQKSVV